MGSRYPFSEAKIPISVLSVAIPTKYRRGQSSRYTLVPAIHLPEILIAPIAARPPISAALTARYCAALTSAKSAERIAFRNAPDML